MRISLVVGARPNFMKVAPIVRALAKRGLQAHLIHTGQHYDEKMSKVFFEELELPRPDVYLGVGSGSHAVQTATIMTKVEPVLLKERPDWLVVVGDVNSTIACALVASKLQIPVAHVEAGLRSGDRGMPEEINRVVTDHISDLLFTSEPSGNSNLRVEGIPDERVRYVGNVMIDSLVHTLPKVEAGREGLYSKIGLNKARTSPYILVTMHRPSNVDNPENLAIIGEAIQSLSNDLEIVFPVHPRTRSRLQGSPLERNSRVHLLEPVGYVQFLGLMQEARLVLTDSGGIQEETAFLGVPCLTARENTERPVTIDAGTNRLVTDLNEVVTATRARLTETETRRETRIELWDGSAAERIVAALTGTLIEV